MKLDDLHKQDVLNRSRQAIIATGLLPTCCIASAAVWIGVLKHFGFKPQPVSVVLDVLNPPFNDFFERLGRLPEDAAEMDALAEQGGYIVGLGHPKKSDTAYGAIDPKTNSWSGHLIVAVRPRGVEGTGYIVDLSIPQAHRPHKGIILPQPLVIPTPAEELRKFIDGGQARGKVGKCLLVYRSVPGDATYHVSPDWTDRKVRWSVLVDELTQAIAAYGQGVRDVAGFKKENAP